MAFCCRGAAHECARRGSLLSARVEPILTGQRPPGVYRWLSRAHPEAVRRELDAAGWYWAWLDGRAIRDRMALFDACAAALRFPAWFGHTWTAFAECLGDLSWLPAAGYVLGWEHHGVLGQAEPETWHRAVEACAAVCAKRDPPLYVLLRGSSPCDLPRL